MTKRQKIDFQRAFLDEAGDNLKMMRELMRGLPDTGFYVKDAQGRIVTLNPRNCENCNFKDEYEAVGLRSDELFPDVKAGVYQANDRKVLRTGRPVSTLHTHAADGSMKVLHGRVAPVRSADGTRIIGTMCAYWFNREPQSSLDWHSRIKDVTSYINAHHAEDLSLKVLSALAATTPSKLVRLFLKVLRTTPAKYVTNVRVNVARTLLEETDRSLTDIAQESGFYDLSHFFHVFRRERGLSPSDYRQRHRTMSRA